MVLPAGSSNLDALTGSNPAGTTFYLQAGRHTLGGGSPNTFSQVATKDGNVYVGAPGAVLDGLSVCRYAFSQQSANVTIRHLEIRGFVCPFDEFTINHDAAPGWTIEYCHIHHNKGAGIGIGTNNTVQYCWLHHNQQYGFSSYRGPVNDGLTSAITNVVIDHCEISHNGDRRDEELPDGTVTARGRNGSGKFWDTENITVSNSWVHHSFGTAIWADTNNVSCLIDGNLIEDNAGVAFFYEISYNLKVTNNTFRRNNLPAGVDNNIYGNSFPRAAIYISESGGDSRVAALYASSEITGNAFINNWDDIALWESADRFCNSPGNTSAKVYKPRGGAASLAVCNNPTIKTLTVTLTSGSPNFTVTSGALENTDEGRPISGTGIPTGTKISEPVPSSGWVSGFVSATSGVMSANATTSGSVTMTLAAGTIDVNPANYDCRWHTQNIVIQNNTFDHNASEVYGSRNVPNSNPLYASGKHGMFSQWGTFPSWSPYQGTTIQDRIVTQGNVWRNNAYRGDYRFILKDTSNQVDFATWQASPYNQDVGSTFSATPPVGGGGGTAYLPDPPTAVTATAGNGQARVNFAPPVDTGGDDLVGYTVTASPGGATVSALSGPITVTGLTNGTAYTFTVIARSAIGDSVASSASAAVTPSAGASLPATTIPWQPIKPAAKAGASSAAISFFTPDSTGGATITGYTVTASPGGATGTGTTSPVTVSGLANGTYTFTVTATNSAGTGPASQPTPQVTVTDTGQPPDPGGATTYRLFGGVSGPGSQVSNDPDSYTLGVEFYVTQSGYTLTQIHFWAAGTVTGSDHASRLYQVTGASTGTLVSGSSKALPSPLVAGWNTVTLDSPITLTANQRYRAAVYFTTDNGYTATSHYWDQGAGGSGIASGPLVAPNSASATDGAQNSFNAGLDAYPSGTFNAGNYWIDVTIAEA